MKLMAMAAFLILTACVTTQPKVVYTPINKVEVAHKKTADSVKIFATHQSPQGKFIELGTLLVSGKTSSETVAATQMQQEAALKGADAIIMQPPIRKGDSVTFWATAIKYAD